MSSPKPDRGYFTEKVKTECWEKSEKLTGRHPDRWRKDADGHTVFNKCTNCEGSVCYGFDHIKPLSQGGKSVVENCQILRTGVNTQKSELIEFDDELLDALEMATYGDVLRPGHECRCKSVGEMSEKIHSKDNMDACELPAGYSDGE